jgi:hypothetical protein
VAPDGLGPIGARAYFINAARRRGRRAAGRYQTARNGFPEFLDRTTAQSASWIAPGCQRIGADLLVTIRDFLPGRPLVLGGGLTNPMIESCFFRQIPTVIAAVSAW